VMATTKTTCICAFKKTAMQKLYLCQHLKCLLIMSSYSADSRYLAAVKLLHRNGPPDQQDEHILLTYAARDFLQAARAKREAMKARVKWFNKRINLSDIALYFSYCSCSTLSRVVAQWCSLLA